MRRPVERKPNGAIEQRVISFQSQDYLVIKKFADREGYYYNALVKNALRIAYGLKFPGDDELFY